MIIKQIMAITRVITRIVLISMTRMIALAIDCNTVNIYNNSNNNKNKIESHNDDSIDRQ